MAIFAYLVIMSLKLNTSYRINGIIALLISLWLVFFLILIQPFDVSDLDLMRRVFMMPLYGLITFTGYIILVPLQNLWFERQRMWTLLSESIFIFTYLILVLLGCYGYYISDILNGDYSFIEYILGIYFPISFVFLPIVIVLRWLFFKKNPTTPTDKILLLGENKLDSLSITYHDLVTVSSADNYVEVNYLTSGVLQKKLLRNTLKNISTQVPTLMQTHRSYLINPQHLVEWKDSKTILVNQLEIPVTKTYKDSILKLQTRP